MAGVLEENRHKIAFAILIVGFALILIGIVLIVQHQYYLLTTRGDYYQEISRERNAPIAQTIKSVLFWLMVIVGIFSVGTLAMIRWSRRFRAYLFRKPNPPTPVDDVWSQHKIPGDNASEENDLPSSKG